ncbi:ATP-binding protein [Actinomadura harenae]|nr:ATP-binding protein [Actinomadura harenae]
MDEQANSGASDAGDAPGIFVGGNAYGHVVCGDHNIVFNADGGSIVNVATPRPEVVRRERIRLQPRRQNAPLGRDEDLAALRKAVRSSDIVQLYGPSGVGTSTLLRQFAGAEPAVGAGVVYLDARGREVTDLAQEIFEACYRSDVPYAPAANELRRLMVGVDVTVCLDNADLTGEHIQALADYAPAASFVLASHERTLQGLDGTAIAVDGLCESAAMALLSRELPELQDDERAAASKLWSATGGRPLLLLRAAAFARNSGSASHLPRPGDVPDLVPLLLDQCGTTAEAVLKLLATLDATLTPADIGALTGADKALCEELARLGLLIADERGYRCAADAVAAVSNKWNKPFPIDRVCGHYIDWTARPTTEPEQVAARSAALEQAVELAHAAGHDALAVRLARAAAPKLAASRHTDAWARMLGLGWQAAHSAGDKRAEAYFLHEEGVRSLVRGRYVVGALLLAEAIHLWRKLQDAHSVGAAQHANQLLPNMATSPIPAHGAPLTPASHMANLAPVHHTAVIVTPPPLPPTPVPPSTTPSLPHSAVPGTGARSPGAGSNAPGASGKAGGAAGKAATSAPHAATPVVSSAATSTASSAAGAAAGSAAVAKFIAIAAVLIGVVFGPKILDAITKELNQPSPNDLSGVWVTPAGTVKITSQGSGSYGLDECGTTLTFSGGAGTFEGTVPIHNLSEGSCGSRIGTARLTITISSDGRSATVEEGTPILDGGSLSRASCSVCGSWTRPS